MTKYRVRPGDTLGRIAFKFYGDARRSPLIVAANAIANPDRLAVGQELIIPDANLAAAGLAPATPVTATTPSSPGDRVAALTEKRLGQLHPGLASRGRSMIELCAQAGIAILVTQGLRTWEEQDALYAKGRTAPPVGKKHIVTNARGGQSWHNFGLAFDVVVLDSVGKANWDTSHPAWGQTALIGKSLGLEWGGDWKGFKDLPHFQYTGGMTLAECRDLFPQGLEAIWSRVT